MSIKAPEIAPILDLRQVDANLIMKHTVAMPETAPEGLVANVEEGGYVGIPDYMSGDGRASDRLVVPALQIETYRGNSALLVDLHGTDARLRRPYEETVKAGVGMEDRLKNMAFESAVKMLDTNGAEGLHHLHHNRYFPYTIYYATSRGNGLRPHVFMTRLGDMRRGGERLPVLGMVTATKDAAAERRFFSLMGGR